MGDDWCVSMHVEQHLRLMTTKADKSHLLCNTVFSLTTVAGLLYLLGDHAFRFLHLAEDVNVSSRHFPVKIQFPFEQAEQSPIYELLFVILFVHGMANTCTIATLDTLIASLVSITYLPPSYNYIRNRFMQLVFGRESIVLRQ